MVGEAAGGVLRDAEGQWEGRRREEGEFKTDDLFAGGSDALKERPVHLAKLADVAFAIQRDGLAHSRAELREGRVSVKRARSD